eukprot:376799-Ditylum_brightwellii.AAC.1
MAGSTGNTAAAVAGVAAKLPKEHIGPTLTAINTQHKIVNVITNTLRTLNFVLHWDLNDQPDL